MPPIDEPPSFERTPSAEARKRKASAPPPAAAGPDLITFTIDAAGGRIIAVERVDVAGIRHELTDDDRTRLAGNGARGALQGLIEQAFEAGIGCVLGETAGESEAAESAEDAELRLLLLRSLIAHGRARRLLQADVLNRAVVGALIERAASGQTSPAESTAAH
jgi:hypothetical protein